MARNRFEVPGSDPIYEPDPFGSGSTRSAPGARHQHYCMTANDATACPQRGSVPVIRVDIEPDRAEVAQVIHESYRRVAPATLVRRLDE